MLLKPNPLRILILACVYGYSAQGAAADTAWNCKVDPTSGSWNCQQNGPIEQARAALSMARHAAGKKALSEEQIGQMLQPPVATPQKMPPPLATQPMVLPDTSASQDLKGEIEESSPIAVDVTPKASSEAQTHPEKHPEKPEQDQAKAADLTEPQVIAVERNQAAEQSPAKQPPEPEPFAANVIARPEPILPTSRESAADTPAHSQAHPQTNSDEPQNPPVPDQAPDSIVKPDVAQAAESAKSTESTQSPTSASPSEATAPIEFQKPVQEGAWEQLDLLGMDIAATLDKDRRTRATSTDLTGQLAPLRKMVESQDIEASGSEDQTVVTEEGTDPEIVLAPNHFQPENPIPFLPPVTDSKFYSVCGAQPDYGLTHNIPAYRPANLEAQPTYAEADSIQGRPGEIMSLIGDAVMQRGDQTIRSNTIHYNRQLERADFSENVELRESGMAMNAERGHYLMGSNDGEFATTQIYLPDRHARISADSVTINARDLIDTTNTTYTTCNYGDDFWMLDAEEVNLDRTTGRGEAWNAWGKIKGVPVIWTPYISFPIDDRRKTGFLLPSYGNSDDNGTLVDIPFYWNIAPNYDATINTRYIEKRGLLFENEFRYLHANNHGTVNANIISSDDIFQDDRGYFSLKHYQQLTPELDVKIDAAHVSDALFLKDFDSTLYNSSLTNLVREAEFNYYSGNYQVKALFQDNYLIDRTIAPASRPYRLLPQLTASTSHYDSDTGNLYSLNGEFTYFQNSARLETQRISINPKVSHTLSSSWGYITPAADLFATQWFLDDPAQTTASSDALVVPGFSVDSGVYIDKEFTFQGHNLMHSIEPRLFYAYVPHIDQNGHPNFDSSQVGLTFTNLFRVNRYSGRDRVGDANQITAAITNRISDQDHSDLNTYLSVGETFYLEDREIGAANEPNSAFFGEFSATLPYNLTITNQFQWDHRDSRTGSIEWRFEWKPSDDHFVLYEYKATRDTLRESVIALRVPLTNQLDFLYKRRRNHLTDDTIRRFWGLEYQSCCWAARFGALKDPFQSTVSNATTATNKLEPETQVYLQFEFKGLVGVGARVDNLFEEEVTLD